MPQNNNKQKQDNQGTSGTGIPPSGAQTHSPNPQNAQTTNTSPTQAPPLVAQQNDKKTTKPASSPPQQHQPQTTRQTDPYAGDFDDFGFGGGYGGGAGGGMDSGFGGGYGGFPSRPGPSREPQKRLTPEERVQMIEKVYNEILSRKPDTRDINYYKYSTLNEEQIRKQLIASAEHKDMIQKGREYEKLKERSEQLETRVRMLEGQLQDHVEEFRELSNLLQEKNRYIQELRSGQTHAMPQPQNGPISAADAAQPLVVDDTPPPLQQTSPQPLPPSEEPAQSQPVLKEHSPDSSAPILSEPDTHEGHPQQVFTSDSPTEIPPPPSFEPETTNPSAPPEDTPEDSGGISKRVRNIFSTFF